MHECSSYDAIVIGVSAGGFSALEIVLPALPHDFPLPIMLVQHLHKDSDEYFIDYFDERCSLKVQAATAGTPIQSGYCYFAASNYHLLVEDDKTLALATEPKVKYSLPSIDVLFDSAADVYEEKLIGLILTGANNDGADGLFKIYENGGLCLVQNPKSAEFSMMPSCAADRVSSAKLLDLEDIAPYLIQLCVNN